MTTSRPNFQRFRFLAPCQRLRAIVCVFTRRRKFDLRVSTQGLSKLQNVFQTEKNHIGLQRLEMLIEDTFSPFVLTHRKDSVRRGARSIMDHLSISIHSNATHWDMRVKPIPNQRCSSWVSSCLAKIVHTREFLIKLENNKMSQSIQYLSPS